MEMFHPTESFGPMIKALNFSVECNYFITTSRPALLKRAIVGSPPKDLEVEAMISILYSLVEVNRRRSSRPVSNSYGLEISSDAVGLPEHKDLHWQTGSRHFPVPSLTQAQLSVT